jgi:hypothetical protein
MTSTFINVSGREVKTTLLQKRPFASNFEAPE